MEHHPSPRIACTPTSGVCHGGNAAGEPLSHCVEGYAPILLNCALWVRVALFCGTVGEGEVFTAVSPMQNMVT